MGQWEKVGRDLRERELGVWDNEAWAKAILFASYSNLILEHGITAWGDGKL